MTIQRRADGLGSRMSEGQIKGERLDCDTQIGNSASEIHLK